ncbi:MAG: penicillin acylase family protein, partial [Calditrichales bacterium]
MSVMNYKKIITVILLSLIILVAILAGSGYLLLRASLPERSGQSIISGAASPINIFFDDKGIPQVWAETEADAWYAVGWLHGEDRLFQMELTRRIASGRLSEMIGDITLSIDRRQRQIGHRIMAVRDISDLAEPYKGYLQAYVNGVNQAVENSAALPFEFYLLGIDYEPWTIEDCLTIFSFQTWFSNDLQNNRELQIQAAQKFGVEKAAQLFGDYPAEAPL